MINLIKNELYKIFHKKGIYIVLIITLLYILLTNFIYNSDIIEANYLENMYESELSYIEYLEEIDETNTEEYLYSKTYIELYKYAKSFGEDSWQRYVLSEDVNYASKAEDIISRIIKYEIKPTSNKKDYENAIKEKEELTNELKNLDWKEFLEQEIEQTRMNLNDSQVQEEKYYYQAQLESLKLRQENNVKYGFDEFNEYLSIYQSNRSTELSYENIDEDLLKEEEKKIRDNAIKETQLAKYKIENKIEEVPLNSNHYILSNFYSEYFIMVLVIIVLVSGSIVSEEFSKGTIKLLLVKPYSRTKILMSKYITVLLMVIFAIISTFLMQMIVGGLFFGYDSLSIPYIAYNLSSKTIETISVLKYFLLLSLTILPQLILLATLGFSLSTIFTSTSLANTLTIVGSFGSDIINMLAETFKIEILKFFVTLNWDWSVYLFGGTSPYKGVTFPFSVIVCIFYLILMITITTIIFNKRNIKNI